MFKINTKKLQTILDKLAKVTPNKLLEITKYYKMVIDEDGLSFSATDGNNFMFVTDSTVTGEAFETIIRADQLTRLVNRTSVEEMKFNLTENYLEVVGNGKYQIEILTEEEYPEPEDVEYGEFKEIDLNKLTSVINVNKNSVSRSIADGVLAGYRFNPENVTTSDSVKICINPVKTGLDTLLTQDAINMISALTEEKVKAASAEGSIQFITDSTSLILTEMDGKNIYYDLSKFAEEEFPSSCELSKLSLISILERLTIFIDPFKGNNVSLNFTKEGLEISTTSGSYEIISYNKSNNFKPFSCSVNVVLLKELISAVTTETFTLSYGKTEMLKIEFNGIAEILATDESGDDNE